MRNQPQPRTHSRAGRQIDSEFDESGRTLHELDLGVRIHAPVSRLLRSLPQHQPLDHTPLDQMRLDDFLHVVFVHCGVPHALAIDHEHRAEFASVEATGLVDPDRTAAAETERLNPLLGVLLQGLSALGRTALPTLSTLIEAKKDVSAVVGIRLHADSSEVRVVLSVRCVLSVRRALSVQWAVGSGVR